MLNTKLNLFLLSCCMCAEITKRNKKNMNQHNKNSKPFLRMLPFYKIIIKIVVKFIFQKYDKIIRTIRIK